jgi:iron complex outermembrane recepter protein
LALSDMGLGARSGRIFATSGLGWLHGYSIQTLPGTRFQNYAGTNTIASGLTSSTFPKWKAVTTVGYGLGGATASVRWRYQNAMKDVTAVTTPATAGVGVPTYSLVDVLGTYAINQQWEVRAGITNAGNHGPIYVSSSQFSTDASVFDIVGRAYYVGVHLTL